ncbi:MAG: ribbon-helix-helix protein, CopG family [Candidatus Omnitrophica bacterium]|nr:ribbon-helix-helix protein, CopG family [Candidatus Omnitrophota bacterium]
MVRPVDKEAKNLGYTSITIRMDHDTIDRLDEYCKRKNVVRSEFVRSVILEAIKK